MSPDNSFPPSPVKARHCEPSMIFSADDDLGPPSSRLIDIALAAIEAARHISLEEISRRMQAPPFFPDIWPGEHYRLLAAVVQVMNPATVVEIGTATGLSALALKKCLRPGGQVVTFDVIRWAEVERTALNQRDFTDGSLIQYVDNLEDPSAIMNYQGLLQRAEIIFIDAAKDGISEGKFIRNLRELNFSTPPTRHIR